MDSGVDMVFRGNFTILVLRRYKLVSDVNRYSRMEGAPLLVLYAVVFMYVSFIYDLKEINVTKEHYVLLMKNGKTTRMSLMVHGTRVLRPNTKHACHFHAIGYINIFTNTFTINTIESFNWILI